MALLRTYATLARLRARQGFSASDVSDDGKLLAKLRAATSEIDQHTQLEPGFQPLMVTRKYDYQSALGLTFRSQTFASISAITDGQGFNVPVANVILLGDADAGNIYGFDCDPTKQFLTYLATKKRAISVTGVAVLHEDYANAWHASNLTITDNPLTIGATTVNLSGNPTSTADSWAQTPAISPGQLIQVDSEWMHVVATGATSLTVVRGANGSTAAQHNQASAVSVYEAPHDIQDITTRWAAWLYKQDDTQFGTSVIMGMGHTIVPAALLADLETHLAGYRKVRVT